jgi:hypothetical protein
VKRRGSVLPLEPMESSLKEDDYALPSFLDQQSAIHGEDNQYLYDRNERWDHEEFLPAHAEARVLEELGADEMLNQFKKEMGTHQDFDGQLEGSGEASPNRHTDPFAYSDPNTNDTDQFRAMEVNLGREASKKEDLIRKQLEERLTTRKTISKPTRNTDLVNPSKPELQVSEAVKPGSADQLPKTSATSSPAPIFLLQSGTPDIPLSKEDYARFLAYIEQFLLGEKNPTTCVVTEYERRRLLERFGESKRKTVRKLCRLLSEFFIGYINFLEGSISSLTYSKSYLMIKNSNLIDENRYLIKKVLTKNNEDTTRTPSISTNSKRSSSNCGRSTGGKWSDTGTPISRASQPFSATLRPRRRKPRSLEARRMPNTQRIVGARRTSMTQRPYPAIQKN